MEHENENNPRPQKNETMRNENQNMTKRESLLHGQKKILHARQLKRRTKHDKTHRTESRAKKKTNARKMKRKQESTANQIKI